MRAEVTILFAGCLAHIMVCGFGPFCQFNGRYGCTVPQRVSLPRSRRQVGKDDGPGQAFSLRALEEGSGRGGGSAAHSIAWLASSLLSASLPGLNPLFLSLFPGCLLCPPALSWLVVSTGQPNVRASLLSLLVPRRPAIQPTKAKPPYCLSRPSLPACFFVAVLVLVIIIIIIIILTTYISVCTTSASLRSSAHYARCKAPPTAHRLPRPPPPGTRPPIPDRFTRCYNRHSFCCSRLLASRCAPCCYSTLFIYFPFFSFRVGLVPSTSHTLAWGRVISESTSTSQHLYCRAEAWDRDHEDGNGIGLGGWAPLLRTGSDLESEK